VSSILERDDAIDPDHEAVVTTILADIPDPVQASHAVAVQNELRSPLGGRDGPGPAAVDLTAMSKSALDAQPAPQGDVTTLARAAVDDESLSSKSRLTPLSLTNVLTSLAHTLVVLTHSLVVLAHSFMTLLTSLFATLLALVLFSRRARAPRLCERRRWDG